MDLSIVVPAFNEEENVERLYRRIVASVEPMGKAFEIIFVDDGSTDGTGDQLAALVREDRRVRVIRFRRNFGQTAALSAGFKHARGDVIVASDADLQNDPADIPRLVAALEDGYDCVSGWRRDRRDPLTKRIISRGANLLRKAFFADRIHDSGCTLKAYRRECFTDLDLYGEMHRFIPALLEWRGFRVGELVVKHHPRQFGHTKYNIIRVLKGLLDMLVVNFWMRFSARPMHLFGGMGILITLAGVLIGGYLSVMKIVYGHNLANRPLLSLAILLLIIGVQFTIFGLLADILIRIYYGSGKGTPPYAIHSVSEAQAADPAGMQGPLVKRSSES